MDIQTQLSTFSVYNKKIEPKSWSNITETSNNTKTILIRTFIL